MRATILLACLALAGAAAAIAMGATHGSGSRRAPLATEASGSFSLVNSRDGMPVFSAANIAPGDSARGTVEIANESSEAVALTLSRQALVDAPGAGGGILSQRLALRIERTGSAALVYQGPLATMPPLALGSLAPGGSRGFEFVATLPQGELGPAAENSVQGASTSVAYAWTAHAIPPAPAHPSPGPGVSTLAPGGYSPTLTPAPRLDVSIVDYRRTLRNGRLIVWARCSQACQVRSRARFLAPMAIGPLEATARHAQRRRFGARTRRLSLSVPYRQRRLLSTAASWRARIMVIARNRDGESAATSEVLHLRRRGPWGR